MDPQPVTFRVIGTDLALVRIATGDGSPDGFPVPDASGAWVFDHLYNYDVNQGPTGTFSAGTIIDITAQVKWPSNNKSVASVENTTASKGLVTAKSAGSATIKASKGNKNGTAAVTVR